MTNVKAICVTILYDNVTMFGRLVHIGISTLFRKRASIFGVILKAPIDNNGFNFVIWYMAYHVWICMAFKPGDQGHGHTFAIVYNNMFVFGRLVRIIGI